MKRVALLVLCAATVALVGRVGAEPAGLVVIEAAELRAQPVSGAATRGRLQVGTSVRRLARSGGWVRVAVDNGGREGWLRMWQVREAEDDGGNPLLRGLERFSRTIAGLFRPRGEIQETPVTATIGVRGLDAGDFEEAAPAPAALERVQALRPSRGDAAAFARGAGLERREIAALGAQPTQDWEDW